MTQPVDPRAALRSLPVATMSPVLTLLDDVALVEHSRLDHPDPALGHCTDDAGRALAVACSFAHEPAAHAIAERCVSFLEQMHLGGGRFVLRVPSPPGPSISDDASGRAIHGLGVAAATSPWPDVRVAARRLFGETLEFDSPHPRARAHAIIGALAVVNAGVPLPGTGELIHRLADGPGGAVSAASGEGGEREASGRAAAADWPWPEPRLTYGNALLVHAMLGVAAVVRDRPRLRRALALLRWLAAVETLPGYFSPTPAGGWQPGEPRPGFDQQPIEAWTMADAALLALQLTGEAEWAELVRRAAAWFGGANDVGVPVWNRHNGRSFDGLTRTGVNENQGAESALAFAATLAALDRVERSGWRTPPSQAARSVSR